MHKGWASTGFLHEPFFTTVLKSRDRDFYLEEKSYITPLPTPTPRLFRLLETTVWDPECVSVRNVLSFLKQ